MKEFHIVCNGLKLHAKLEKPEAEKCPLAIIFHGLTGHMEEEHIKAAADTFLKAGIAALRVDLFGHGQSEGEFGEHNLLKWIDNGLCVVNYAKSLDNQAAFDFLARRLYDMTCELVMSLLIIRDAAKAPELFLKSANVYVRMAEENVLGKAAYIKNFCVDDLENFKAEEEPAEA